MARPTKWRRVAILPDVAYFKPAGIPMRSLAEVQLSVEGLEALRLKDIDGLDQETCAAQMHISRPTFHRILESARHTVADALLNGKAIRIEGGNYELALRHYQCVEGHEWDVPFEAMASAASGAPMACPRCQSLHVTPMYPERSSHGRGRRRRGGRSDLPTELEASYVHHR